MNKRIDCPVVILSGGKSSRMGTDKSLLPFDGYTTLIEYQYHKLQKIFKEVYISSKEDKFDFLEDKTKLIQDDNNIYSPMVALKSILNRFKDSYVFIVAVDIPFLTNETIQKLYTNTKKNHYNIALPIDKNGDRHNLCGFYHTSVIKQIENLLDKDVHRIGALIQSTQSITITFNSIEEFLNLNDQETYKKVFHSL